MLRDDIEQLAHRLQHLSEGFIIWLCLILPTYPYSKKNPGVFDRPSCGLTAHKRPNVLRCVPASFHRIFQTLCAPKILQPPRSTSTADGQRYGRPPLPPGGSCRPQSTRAHTSAVAEYTTRLEEFFRHITKPGYSTSGHRAVRS